MSVNSVDERRYLLVRNGKLSKGKYEYNSNFTWTLENTLIGINIILIILVFINLYY